MGRVWTATPRISFTLTEEEIKTGLRRHFANPDNPTEAEVEKYFDGLMEDYAGSNDGSELLANARLDIQVSEK